MRWRLWGLTGPRITRTRTTSKTPSARAPSVALFDFGGTLDADGVHWAPRFYEAYRAAGGATDRPRFEQIFKAADQALATLPGIRSLGFRDLVEAEARLLRDLLPPDEAWEPARVAAQFHADALAVVARNRPLLERLAVRYRLGVVSNFTGNLEPCLVELDLRRYFVVAIDSAVIGVSKPDPRIFTAALARLHTSPQHAWMIGDNFDADIRPATDLGLRTCWLTPADRQAPPGVPLSARIACLLDVEAVLGRG
ncbi:MAG TPA: HAD family hydrolase [Gemmatimonadales bacterium]|nr:HAD family hydrolase [Gemmatimonadales bacterium]